jgi:cytosine/adenosine deaminase-related metal-dependent hydrolase
VILVRTKEPHMGDIGDPYDALVQLAQPSDVELVMVDGRILHRNRQFIALDYGKLLADGAQSVATLKAKAKWS